MSNISLTSLPFFKILLIQSVLGKFSFNLLLSKFLLYKLNLGGVFGVIKSSRITNWIKWSEIECVMLPDKEENSKTIEKNIVD